MLVRLVSSPTLRSDKQGRHSRMCELVDMYTKHCRSILEYAVPVWNGAITGYECKDIERVQKMALHIVLGENYLNYENALKLTNLESLESRRMKLCMNFAKKAQNSDKYLHWFRPGPGVNTNTI